MLPLATVLGAAAIAFELATAPQRPKLVDTAFLGWSLANIGRRWTLPWRVHQRVPGGRCRLDLPLRARLLGQLTTTDDRRDCCGRRVLCHRRPRRLEQLVLELLRGRRLIPIGWVGREAHRMQARKHRLRQSRTGDKYDSNVKIKVIGHTRALTTSARPRTCLIWRHRAGHLNRRGIQ